MVVSLAIFIAGLLLIIYSAEKLVEGTVGTSLGFGVSTFLISVIFIGFDPENLALGAVASYQGATGIALGTILGAAMVAIALAFGITALVAPMRFGHAPKQVLIVPVLAVMLLVALCLDGLLSRTDGIVLIIGFVLSIFYLFNMSKRGLDIKPAGEVAESLEKTDQPHKWKSFGLLLLALAGVVVGSEMLVESSETVISALGISETVFGMTILALLVSIEELARELPAALKGRPEISYGNVSGSVLAFFLLNAGVIALVRPVPVSETVLWFHIPLAILTVVTLSLFMLRRRVSRVSGAVLLTYYVVFFAGSYFV